MPQKGTTLNVMPDPNVQGMPFCVLRHQSGNLLTTPPIYHMTHYMFSARCKADNVDQFTQLHLGTTDLSSISPSTPYSTCHTVIRHPPCAGSHTTQVLFRSLPLCMLSVSVAHTFMLSDATDVFLRRPPSCN
jgi:hypothetical protein